MSSYTKRSSARRSDDTMDDDPDDKDDTKRKSRNLSEKKRRDQFNMLVNELSSMVSTGARKMDKSTVLRSTISFLKNHNEIAIRSRAHEIQEDWKPAFLSNEEFTHLILEALDGFIVVFSAAGHVHYVSENVTALLGHLPSQLLNTSVYELVWDEEQAALYQALVGNGASNIGTGPDGQLSFQAHLRRGGGDYSHQQTDDADLDTTHNNCYELVNFVGYLRTDVDVLDTTTTTRTINNQSGDSNRFGGYSGDADTRLFVGTGRLQTPQLIREMSLIDAADIAAATVGSGAAGGLNSGRGGNPGEFTSRHSLEWKFLFLDHRAPPIIGYLPFEVLGTSGYDYYHVDDLDKVVSCHEALMQKGEGTSCYYRFLTKGQQWIWLQTRFYITYHQWNSKPEFIVCTHRVVSYVDVMKQSSNKTNEDSTNNSDSNLTLLESFPVPTSTPGSGTSSPWGGASSSQRESTNSIKTGRRHHHRRAPSGAPSDCTSMSADSPASRQSQSSQQQPLSGRSSSRLSNVSTQVPGSSVPMFVDQSQIQIQPTTTPTQYVATIPMQSAIISGFPSSTTAVLSPLPVQQTIDNSTLILSSSSSNLNNLNSSSSSSSSPNAIQAQLQRKHAELQAIIGQQQAELRRVSEQLLMARLGLLATPGGHQQLPQQPQLIQQQQQQLQQDQTTLMNLNQVSTPYICSSNVSSSTSQVPCIDNTGICPMPISVAVPVVSTDHLLTVAPQLHRRQPDEATTMTLSQQQAQMLFITPGSNNPQCKN